MRGPWPTPGRWRRVLVLGAGLPALSLAILFAWRVVIPHLRFQYHRRLLESRDKEERREAARSLARLGTEEAVRTLLMEIQSGFKESPSTEELGLHLPVEHQLFLNAFKEVDESALPFLVDTLCSSDVRQHGAAFMALLTFFEEEELSEPGGDYFRRLENHGVSLGLLTRAKSCCKEMEEKKRAVFYWEMDESDH